VTDQTAHLDGRLIIASNRLPVRRVGSTWQASAGGLVTALRPVVEQRAATWIGWDGGAASIPQWLPGTSARLAPISLTADEARSYYDGFANRTIWPLFHDNVETPTFDRAWWAAYVQVNERFAACLVDDGDVGLWWVHDYHLMLLPRLLRASGATAPIRFFLHIPWPPPELFARLPWRREILHGLLGSDVVSFHTERYRSNFLATCVRILGDGGARISGRSVVLGDARRVRTAANPISIDVSEFVGLATSANVTAKRRHLEQQFAGRVVLLGVDRLDYTKGLIQRLEAVELVLARRPDLRSRVVLVQLAVPSRGHVREYRGLRAEVEAIAGRMNGRFTEPGQDVPVHYLHRGVPRESLVAYYCHADIMLVTPLKDGMNLVAKEFIICQSAVGRDGTLVLSEFAGAALELREARTCNPFDVEGLSYVIEDAVDASLIGSHDDAVETMARRIQQADVHRWARHELQQPRTAERL
jgi:alpha,alpha-trehalose-phosphate synthase [UDP-forming]